MNPSNKDFHLKSIRASIAEAYKSEQTTVEYDDGTVEKMCVSDALRTSQQMDVRCIKDDFQCAMSCDDDAKDSGGTLYSKSVKGWKGMSVKKREKIIFGDYWSAIDLTEAEYEAEIVKVELVEKAFMEASAWAEEQERIEVGEQNEKPTTL